MIETVQELYILQQCQHLARQSCQKLIVCLTHCSLQGRLWRMPSAWWRPVTGGRHGWCMEIPTPCLCCCLAGQCGHCPPHPQTSPAHMSPPPMSPHPHAAPSTLHPPPPRLSVHLPLHHLCIHPALNLPDGEDAEQLQPQYLAKHDSDISGMALRFFHDMRPNNGVGRIIGLCSLCPAQLASNRLTDDRHRVATRGKHD